MSRIVSRITRFQAPSFEDVGASGSASFCHDDEAPSGEEEDFEASQENGRQEGSPEEGGPEEGSPEEGGQVQRERQPLVAEHVLSVRSRAEAEALAGADRKGLAAAVKGILGSDGDVLAFDGAVDLLDRERMGVYKLRLARNGAAIYDVWINTILDDGVVLHPKSAEPTGIGISQTRVYDMVERRDDLCAAIYSAIYEAGVDLPDFEEWT